MTYIIAEAGVNHNGSMDIAHHLIDAATAAHADAVKFQAFTATKLDPPESQMRKKLIPCELSQANFIELKAHADAVGIDFLLTPFSDEWLDFCLNTLGLTTIKLASRTLISRPFPSISRIIASAGMQLGEEVSQLVSDCQAASSDVTLMHCVSCYPTPTEDANFARMLEFKTDYNISIGYSDHTSGISACFYAVVKYDAAVIEKHITVSTGYNCLDAAVSVDPQEFGRMVSTIRDFGTYLGSDYYAQPMDIEWPALLINEGRFEWKNQHG